MRRVALVALLASAAVVAGEGEEYRAVTELTGTNFGQLVQPDEYWCDRHPCERAPVAERACWRRRTGW